MISGDSGDSTDAAWAEQEDLALDAVLEEGDAGETQYDRYGMDRADIEVSLSAFTQSLICFDEGKHVSYEYRPWMPRIMDSEHSLTRVVDGEPAAPRWTLLKCSRQVEKSSSKSFKMLALSMLVPNICCLYVSSAGANTREFADERIENTLRISPKLRPWAAAGLKDTMAVKRFANNSRIVLRSVYRDNAERVRGLPVDVLAVDEIQSVFPDAMPIIEASLKNSDLPMGHIRLYSGTPLTSNNHLEQRWSRESTQNLWLTRCGSCGHWNPPGMEQIGKKGMICSKCGYGLNPLKGQWIRTGKANAPYEGYHLSQVIMPYTHLARGEEAFKQKWSELYADVHSPTAIEAKVRNEIIGESWDVGRKPVSSEDLRQCVRPWLRFRRIAPDNVLKDRHWHTFMGVDWGSGTDGNAYTVVTLLYAYGDDLRPCVYYMKRYEGTEADPKFIKHDIAALYVENDVSLAFVDAGYGWGIISDLRDMVPNGLQRIVPVQMVGSQGQVIKYNKEAHRFTAHRTRWMAKIFSLIKSGKLDLGCEEDFWTPFAEDILNIHYEELPSGQMRYGHVGTDDSFHSLMNAITAKMYFYQELWDFANA